MTGRAGGARRHTTPSRREAVTCALGSAHRQAAALSALMVLVLALVLLLLTVPARALTVTDWILTDRPVGSDHTLEGQGTTDDQSLAGRLIVCCETMDDLRRIEVLANELGVVVKATLPQLKAALLSPTVPAQDHVGNVLPEHLTDALLAPAPVASKWPLSFEGSRASCPWRQRHCGAPTVFPTTRTSPCSGGLMPLDCPPHGMSLRVPRL